MSQLKRAENIRFSEPRCCMTCKHKVISNGVLFCLRPYGHDLDMEEDMWMLICDGYKREQANEN